MFRFTSRFVRCAAAALTSAVLAGAACAQQPYKVVDHWKIGGTGGWDYLLADSGNHLLYVTHGPRVEILDTRTGKPAGAITGLKGTHGIALDSEGKFGYISDGGGNDVLVFDRKNFTTVATVATGTNPDGIVFDPATRTVWAFNGKSNNATVIDAASNKVVATIALPGKPEFPAADGKGSVYVNIETKNSIVRLDSKTKSVVSTWKLEGCESPSGLAFDPAHRRLFAVCDGNKMAVVDADSGKPLASPAIGEGPDAAGFNEKNQFAFSSNGGGTLTVIDAAHDYKVLQNLATEKGARTMAYDAATDRIFFSTAQYGPRPATGRAPVLPDSFSILVVGH